MQTILNEIKVPENKIELAIKKTLKEMNNSLEKPQLIVYSYDHITCDRRFHRKIGPFKLIYSKQMSLYDFSDFNLLSEILQNLRKAESILWMDYNKDSAFSSISFSKKEGARVYFDEEPSELLPLIEHFEKDPRIKDIHSMNDAANWFSDSIQYINRFKIK